MLDTGAQILQLSVDHRVATDRAERHRLERTGALIAPIDVSGEALRTAAGASARLRKHSRRTLHRALTMRAAVASCPFQSWPAWRMLWKWARTWTETAGVRSYCTVGHTENGREYSGRFEPLLSRLLLHAGQGPAAGPYAQGWGPLRVWPGGLCLSRALGDFDVGALVLAIPHIMQVDSSCHLLCSPVMPDACDAVRISSSRVSSHHPLLRGLAASCHRQCSCQLR